MGSADTNVQRDARPGWRRSAPGYRSPGSRWSGWKRPACTGRRSSRRSRSGLSAGCSTRITCATSPGARPTSRTPNGSASSCSTDWCGPSFVPPPEIRRLRDLTRLRKAQINERARSIQRLEKVLQDAGIKLSSVASTTYSKSARAMLEALLVGRHRSRAARRARPRPGCAEDPAAARGAREPLPDRAPRRHGRPAARAHRHARRRDRRTSASGSARARPAPAR